MKQLLQKIVFFAFVVALLLPVHLFAQAERHTREYTKEHPMVYEDAWNLWPYCYLNEHGEPEGYNVDLVKMLCEEMGIPYVIKLTSTRRALSDLKEGRSDLMLGLDNRYEQTNLKCGNTIVQLFTHSVVHPKGQKEYVKTIEDLSRQKAIVHKGSFCHHLMENNGWSSNAIAQNDMKAAIKNLSSVGKGQIVWNTMSLKWLMRKYQTDNLEITSVYMPHGSYKFMSLDTVLLARIDEAYKDLSVKSQHFEALQNRWFYPDHQESGIPIWVWNVTVVIAFLALVLLFFNLMYRYRERKMMSLILQDTNRLSHILKQSHMSIWTYDIATSMFVWMDVEQRTENKLTPIEMDTLFSHTDFVSLCDAIRQVETMEQEQVTLEMKGCTPANSKVCDFVIVLSVLSRKDGKPSSVLGTMCDVTRERNRQQQTKTLLSRYQSIFDNAMVDMIFYDSDGYIANMNNRAVRTFGMTKEKARELRVNLKDIIGQDNIDLKNFDYYHVTRALDVYNQFLPDEEKHDTKIYYEFQLVPVRDSEQRLLGTYGTGIEVTDFVNVWRQQKENIRKLKEANKEVEAYINNIDYMLKVGGVRMANYSPKTHTLTIYSETNVVQHTLTQSRFVMLLDDSSKKRALKLLNSMDDLTTQPIDTVVLTNLRSGGQPLYLQVSLVPTFNKQGEVENYFGLCRDVTDIKVSEQQLEKETERAKEVEELKNSFLRNMSYEIRTPLNTVVGFAELFENDHQQEDETIFVKEIKDNAAHLLHLINDILFLSRLDAHMIEINRQPTDFAKTFESHCSTGWANMQHEGVRYAIYNHFEQLVVNIDDANLGLIINQITTNAAQHTTSGTVRARYDYFDGKLMIAVEDTGSGITEENMKHIFERFNTGGKGTGLGLPICLELAKQMGGHIDINSKVGNGTTVWVVIPCELIAMERKIDNFILT